MCASLFFKMEMHHRSHQSSSLQRKERGLSSPRLSSLREEKTRAEQREESTDTSSVCAGKSTARQERATSLIGPPLSEVGLCRNMTPPTPLESSKVTLLVPLDEYRCCAQIYLPPTHRGRLISRRWDMCKAARQSSSTSGVMRNFLGITRIFGHPFLFLPYLCHVLS